MTLQNFLKLPMEKQKTIIDACIHEFAQYDYDLASTNRIVEQARISKGVLFKYFSNKETLFVYICELVAEKVLDALTIKPNELPADFFEGVKMIALKEISFYKNNPEVFALFDRIMKNPEHSVYQKVLEKFTIKSNEAMGLLINLLSHSNLRQGVSVEQAITLVTWVAEGIKRKFREMDYTKGEKGVKELESEVMSELSSYFELLKYGIYK